MNAWPGNIGNPRLDKWLRRAALGAIVGALFVGLPAIATMTAGGSSTVERHGETFDLVQKGAHLKLGERPLPEAVITADPIISCAPWGHPDCIMDIHPPGNYFQPYCACRTPAGSFGPAFACCNGPNQPCA